MGLLSWISEKAMDVLDWVEDRVNNVFDFIEDRMDDVENFFSGGKKKLGKTSKESAKKISKEKPYNKETAEIGETKAITKILNEIKEEYKTKLKQYEEKSHENQYIDVTYSYAAYRVWCYASACIYG